MYQVFNRVYQTGIPEKSTDYEIIRSDGNRCILALSTSLMRDASGNPVGFRGVVRDITESKLAELLSSLESANAQIAELKAEMEGYKTELQKEKEQMKTILSVG